MCFVLFQSRSCCPQNFIHIKQRFFFHSQILKAKKRKPLLIRFSDKSATNVIKTLRIDLTAEENFRTWIRVDYDIIATSLQYIFE